MTELKLAKLPDRSPIKVTLSITPALNSALAAYQALYREVYGVEAPVTDLMPAMLAQFLSSDRSFAKEHQNWSSGSDDPVRRESVTMTKNLHAASSRTSPSRRTRRRPSI